MYRRWILIAVSACSPFVGTCFFYQALDRDEGADSGADATCPDPRLAGDHVSGRDCWEPATGDYCKDGLGGLPAWFCTKDASKCCLASFGDCFRCGWVRMSDCTVAGESDPGNPVLCKEIDGILSPQLSACVHGLASEADCTDLSADPACSFSPTVPVCLLPLL